uniref:Lipase family protein n=1 Tax=Roseihalotalea indica TaxID=2867963 RepID=A0AA49GPT9_9BACT|nr:lipase family protein [Tunicatimonas sp. TK19036]
MRRLLNTHFLLLGIFLITIITACQTDDVPEPDGNDNQFLVEQEFVASFTVDQLKLFASFTEFADYQDLIEYGLTLYKITYRTEFKGESVVASGIISIPQGDENFPVVLGAHGTITSDNKAPSNLNFSQNNASGFELFGAFGFIGIIPDYLGFGASSELVHPYFNYASSARSSIDMIRATQEFLSDSIAYNPELFLTGYSQGGYVAMSTLKFLEENPTALPDFTITATAIGAGGYDIRGGMESIFQNTIYPSSVNLAFLVYSYHETNDWQRPLTDFFQDPYAAQVPELFDGSTDAGIINSELPANLNFLLKPAFIAAMRDGTETQFLTALEENSVHDWAPQTPVRLYHEQDDEVIPIQNSEDTYKTMMKNGAPDVYYFPYDAASNHGEGAQPMYEQVIPWFISLRSFD